MKIKRDMNKGEEFFMTERTNSNENKISNAKMFNTIAQGTIAKLHVLSELFSTANGFDEDADDEIILYEAARLEDIFRSQAKGICECLRALLECNGLLMLKKLIVGDLTPPKFFLGVKKENDRKICGHCYNIFIEK